MHDDLSEGRFGNITGPDGSKLYYRMLSPPRQPGKRYPVFVHVYGRDRQHFSELMVFPIPSTPPPREEVYKVVTIGVRGYPDGLYDVDALFRCDQLPPSFRKQGSALKVSPSPSA